ncbi:hypothetical protein SFRURICE_017061 [Spodoptera frugiperda]|nr:hypothetical protein SFRURICE_017061 [Spodoptera frugiperda]
MAMPCLSLTSVNGTTRLCLVKISARKSSYFGNGFTPNTGKALTINIRQSLIRRSGLELTFENFKVVGVPKICK